MSSLDKLYQKELKLLKSSAQVFSEQHPALTEHLARQSNDPDVEMILQGVAYLSAQFKQEVDNAFPQAIQSLSQVLTPTLMQPLPSAAILSFKPKTNLLKPMLIEAGKCFDSEPVGYNTSKQHCRFTNSWPIEVLPIELNTVTTKLADKLHDSQNQRVIHLKFDFDASRNDIANYEFGKLRLHLNQALPDASLWLLMFARNVNGIVIKDDIGEHLLSAQKVKLIGFDTDAKLFQYDDAAPLHQLLQEYFTFPEKFMCVELDIQSWQQRAGVAFSITVEFDQPNWALPEIDVSHFHLYTSPVVNEFEHFAEPLTLSESQHEFPIYSKFDALSGDLNLEIVDVLSVEGVKQNRQTNRKFENALRPKKLNSDKPGYHFYRKFGPQDGITSTWLGLSFSSKYPLEQDEILRAKVKCSQGRLAEQVTLGQLRKPTSSSPELVHFENITVCSEFQHAQVATHTAWQVISDQALSLNAIKDAEQLKKILSHHIPKQTKLSAKQKTNLFRIAAIESVQVSAKDHFYQGVITRGKEIQVGFNGEHFSNIGDQFLFSAVLNQLFALQTPLNSFCQLVTIDLRTGEQMQWPMLMGSL
ncbi:type VI secretion system baseplate subunit TssF [Pseudoalteromonas ulvae]|uniref:Type VI secretion system protein ImpG n=1 Tax=Pseudoalteromonas ulvae TaxID=107327 RepID=A0A244CRG8_PSEDV|nr:type VI secretion system baseplate subunit TssF [Pseudoalteromonas ulvae]OUL58194.1 hypothetical protein B1199_07520 [Pseudoalteromonas ulvae]